MDAGCDFLGGLGLVLCEGATCLGLRLTLSVLGFGVVVQVYVGVWWVGVCFWCNCGLQLRASFLLFRYGGVQDC